MKKRTLILVSILLIVALVGAGTFAYFSDTETSNDNTFSAGSIDLNVNGHNGTNTVVFNISNMYPDNQPTGAYNLYNSGTLPGYLDIGNVVVTSLENAIIEPETEAGDATPDAGELQNVLNLRLYNDVDKDGYYSSGDVMIFSGLLKDFGGTYNTNIMIPAGGTVRLNAVYDWWSTGTDNLAMTDSVDIDMTFILAQKP